MRVAKRAQHRLDAMRQCIGIDTKLGSDQGKRERQIAAQFGRGHDLTLADTNLYFAAKTTSRRFLATSVLARMRVASHRRAVRIVRLAALRARAHLVEVSASLGKAVTDRDRLAYQRHKLSIVRQRRRRHLCIAPHKGPS